jgi:hypothetical protein
MTNDFENTLLLVAPASVLEGLPPHLREIPDLVAQATGISVQVLSNRTQPPTLIPNVGNRVMPLMLDINANTQSITIWCAPFAFSSLQLGHQLIALRRYVLESVPRFTPAKGADPETRASIIAMENELELLFLIQEEANTFPDAVRYWNEEFKAMIPIALETNNAFYLAMMFAQIRVSLFGQSDLLDMIEPHLHRFGDKTVALAEDIWLMYTLALPNKGFLLADMTTAMSPELLSQVNAASFIIKDGVLASDPRSLAVMRAQQPE